MAGCIEKIIELLKNLFAFCGLSRELLRETSYASEKNYANSYNLYFIAIVRSCSRAGTAATVQKR